MSEFFYNVWIVESGNLDLFNLSLSLSFVFHTLQVSFSSSSKVKIKITTIHSTSQLEVHFSGTKYNEFLVNNYSILQNDY